MIRVTRGDLPALDRIRARLAALVLVWSTIPTAVGAEEGFEDLFDGRSLDGWVVESHADSEVHADGRAVWSVQDGEIACDGLGFGFLRWAREALADCTLRLEFRLDARADGKPCNSGIGLRTGVFDRRRSRATRPSIRGYELQLIDDAGGPPSTHSSGALYRYLAPRENALRPTGEWNALEVSMIGTRIRVVMNGRLLHDVDQEEHPALRSKPLSGYVALQNHGGPARFRAIRVRRETGPVIGARALEAQGAILARRGADLGIRGVLRFALEAAGRGWNAAAVEEALGVARSMQVTDPGDEQAGNFRWRLGDRGVTDTNACEFAAQLLAMLRLEDEGLLVPRPGGRRLSPRARELVDAMARDVLPAVRRHRVEPGYTNMALLRAWNLLALDPSSAAEGAAAWRDWRAFTSDRGVTEFVSPTYLGIDLDCLALVAAHAPAWEVRVEAEATLEYLWRSVACHWLPAAQRLSGPRSRDYDWLWGRGYGDEHLVDAGWLVVAPRTEGAGWLPRAPRDGLHVYRGACRWEPPGSLRDDVVERRPRFVVERTGERPWQRITDWVGRRASIGIAGEGRGGEDKTLLVNMPPADDDGPADGDAPWRAPNVTLVVDGVGDPYGVVRESDAAGGPAKARHLRPYLVSSQAGPHVTALWLLDPRRAPFAVDPSRLDRLEAHLLVPARSRVWSTEGPLEPGVTLPADTVVFLRGGDCALGVRFLAPADADLRAEGVRFVADGDRPEVRRLTATFARGVPDRGMLLGLDLELLEGCDDAAFAAFRREFAGRSVRLEREGRSAAVRGALPVALDLGTGDERPRRLEFHPVLPEGALLLLDGDEIGRAAFEPDEPR